MKQTKEQILKAFGATLRAYRQQAGLSQERLAAKAGLDRTYVGGAERGERINGGVIVYCRAHVYVAARTHVDEARLTALDPAVDITGVRADRRHDAVKRRAFACLAGSG